MVRLNRIYTRTGDDGTTGLGDGERRSKDDLRVAAYGDVDETNSALGIARSALQADSRPDAVTIETMLARVQNDLFDLGADLCVPPKPDEEGALRISAEQVTALEIAIDALNDHLAPLRSFVLPAGSAATAALHLARAISRRAERSMVTLSAKETVGAPALAYMNRLSDYLFVASRFAARRGEDDVLWLPGAHRDGAKKDS